MASSPAMISSTVSLFGSLPTECNSAIISWRLLTATCVPSKNLSVRRLTVGAFGSTQVTHPNTWERAIHYSPCNSRPVCLPAFSACRVVTSVLNKIGKTLDAGQDRLPGSDGYVVPSHFSHPAQVVTYYISGPPRNDCQAVSSFGAPVGNQYDSRLFFPAKGQSQVLFRQASTPRSFIMSRNRHPATGTLVLDATVRRAGRPLSFV